MAQVNITPDSSLVGQREVKLGKLKKLRDMGIEPYPMRGDRTHSNSEIIEKYDELENTEVKVIGRLMSWREHGQLVFGHIQDASSRLQLYIKEEEINPTNVENQTLGWDDLYLIDIGDHIEAKGIVTKTQRGEISITPKEIRILSKSIRPLPDKWQGLKDTEERYRRRYLDMTMNTEVRHRFERRAKFWKAVQDFLDDKGFYQVNAPVLEHVTGGADAKPFVTYFEALHEDFYLRISQELPLKRLLGAGFEKVYDLGPRFRNEGISDEHLPEHIAMEWYWAYADARDGMQLTEDLFKFVINEVYGKLKFEIKGFTVDLERDWEEIKFVEVIKEKFDVDVFGTPLTDMIKILEKNNVRLGDDVNRSRAVDNLWKLIRKDIAGPAFLIDVPKFMSPLSKSKADNPEITDRFHPIIAGSELANAFAELNDPVDQLDRFVEQQKLRESGDEEAHMMDIDFVEMLEYGMPPACGFGMSERVFWFFEDVTAKEGVPFPHLKQEFDKSTREIYQDIWRFIEEDASENSGEVKKQDLSKKMVIVLNKEIEGWEMTNTIAHISGYLGSKIKEEFTARPVFEDESGNVIPANSQFPIITMVAKPGQMYNLLSKVEEEGLPHLAYVQEMIDFNLDDEVQGSLSKQKKKDMKYTGIGFFGSNEVVEKLTKKFSLYK